MIDTVTPRRPVRTAVPFRGHTIAYWTSTVLIAGELGLGGVWDVLRVPAVRGVTWHLGYPPYFLVILGTWKIAGAAALLVPGLPRLKEWAYAGAVFTYTGAIASYLAVGDGAGSWWILTVFTGLAAVSWALRSPSRRCQPPPARHG